MVLFRPKPAAATGSGPASAPCALISRGATDFFCYQRIDATMRIILCDLGQTGVDHKGNSIDGEGRFSHVGRDNSFGLCVSRDRGVLRPWREVAVERENHSSETRSFNLFDGSRDLKGAGHEDQNVSTVILSLGESVCSQFPDWLINHVSFEVFDRNGKSPTV